MPHAEVEYVWPRDGRVRVTGRLHPGRPGADGAPWWLLLVQRDRTDRRLRREASLDGAAFEASVAVADLVAPDVSGGPGAAEEGQVKWDLYLATEGRDGTVQLRVGRLLDDIEGKKNIMVFPAQLADGGGGPYEVRPFYTIKDNLSVECRPLPAGSGRHTRGTEHGRGRR